jgi:predicted RecB family nuclease
MRHDNGRFSYSPTDLANFVACRHKTTLDRSLAEGRVPRPTWEPPLATVLRARGDAHERRYIDELRTGGLSVVDLSVDRADGRARDLMVSATIDAMRAGIDVIVQAPLGAGRWFGYADVLRKVPGSSAWGDWHYEVHDTKLSRETRGGTILQLCAYTEIVAGIQGRTPDRLHVVTPAAREAYRVATVSAFYRALKQEFDAFVDVLPPTYPDPVEHCDVCRWWSVCNARRRQDDHLSFVAGMGRRHRYELEARDVRTLAACAALPVPLEFLPARGSKEVYERLGHQARLQAEQRATGERRYELLAIDPAFGLCRLPEPRPGDLFLDLEGDPYGRPSLATESGATGREYLFGLGRVDERGDFIYEARWAFTDDDERAAFAWVIAEILRAIVSDPEVHVYHYAPYEPTAFKRLMGRYVSCEAEMDQLLRDGRFVDLYAVVRQALRAGVESYSIKQMEPYYGFRRDVDLERAGDERHLVEIALETGDIASITAAVRATVEGYNKDDCRSTCDLRVWLEALRASAIVAGAQIPRPLRPTADVPERVRDRQRRVDEVRARLLAAMPVLSDEQADDERARQLLAYLLDWQYREDKVAWWEYYRLRDLPPEELADEPAALTGLTYIERADVILHKTTRRPTGSVVDRYAYPFQETDIRRGQTLNIAGDDRAFGTVERVDRVARIVDVKKGPQTANLHPSTVFAHDGVPPDTPARSLARIADRVTGGDTSVDRAAWDLLSRRPPRICGVDLPHVVARPDETMTNVAVRLACDLDAGVLPIQGPPGTGKTFTGARMICALVERGGRVGVTGTSHKVIRNLLDAAAAAAADLGLTVRIGQKIGEHDDDESGSIVTFRANQTAYAALQHREIDVLGGTAWLWSDEALAGAVDVLFVDEAGQMSLANTVAAAPAARSLVLLGDPQQLEQPQKGSHPDGVGVSALQHVLGRDETMPADRGIFLPTTWRLAPAVCAFTSELFYEGKLASRAGLEHQVIAGSRSWDGAGLRLVEVVHAGCRNVSDQEAAVVVRVVEDLLAPGVTWTNASGDAAPLTSRDILVVAPYNAHVVRLQERLDGLGVRVGTVDRFQGQEAPVVIYSMATSHPADAPRGMEFLYSLNRLNVATSRARCLCILVASPQLFEPDCHTPRQMRLANALCRYRELAIPIVTTG